MKLQKTNKYTRRITAGLMSAIISASILTGCNTSAKVDEVKPTEIVEVQSTPLVRDEKYYYDYFDYMDEEKVAEEMNKLNMKFPDAQWRMGQVTSLVIKDKDGNYKVLQTIGRCFRETDPTVIFVYDLFTEELLFNFPFTEGTYKIDGNAKYTNVDLSKAYNKIDYLNDKEIVEYGMCIYSTLFLQQHLNELREKDGVNYMAPSSEINIYMYPESFFANDLVRTVKQIADNYIKTVPTEFRVTTEELGLTPTYKEERKYADCWKITEEEKQKRIEELNITEPDMSLTLDVPQALLIEDSEGYKKIIDLIIIKEEGLNCAYNLFDGRLLFTIDGEVNLKYNYDNQSFDGIDFNKINWTIPYLSNKKFIELDSVTSNNDFLLENIDYLSQRDGIDYEFVDAGYVNQYDLPTEYTTSNVSLTIKELAEVYVTSIPLESQVTSKDLEMGLEKEEDKVLVK